MRVSVAYNVQGLDIEAILRNLTGAIRHVCGQKDTVYTGSLLEVKLVPAVYSRDKQHRTNQIKKGGTRRNTGYPSRKDIFPMRKSKRIMLLALCLRTTARTYRLASVLSHKRIAPVNVLHRQTRVRTLESSILRLRSAIMLNAVRQKH